MISAFKGFIVIRESLNAKSKAIQIAAIIQRLANTITVFQLAKREMILLTDAKKLTVIAIINASQDTAINYPSNVSQCLKLSQLATSAFQCALRVLQIDAQVFNVLAITNVSQNSALIVFARPENNRIPTSARQEIKFAKERLTLKLLPSKALQTSVMICLAWLQRIAKVASAQRTRPALQKQQLKASV
ncbi:hypothetical protein FGO68_gene13802 [Halteria grandinella]|uniref:Uncharacterized protein n=1 Tax=Halteria grandinella TaxID=5974 RepID=A0A8J8T8H0_HALGN|nr:hypothetical protein FGO68_gene13802 [Halteria grandinella]